MVLHVKKPAKKPNLTEEQRSQIISRALEKVVWKDGEPTLLRPHIVKIKIASDFKCHHTTVSKIWTRAKTNYRKTGEFKAPSLKKNTGRRPKFIDQQFLTKKRAEWGKRGQEVADLAKELEVSSRTLYSRWRERRLSREGQVSRHDKAEEEEEEIEEAKIALLEADAEIAQLEAEIAVLEAVDVEEPKTALLHVEINKEIEEAKIALLEAEAEIAQLKVEIAVLEAADTAPDTVTVNTDPCVGTVSDTVLTVDTDPTTTTSDPPKGTQTQPTNRKRPPPKGTQAQPTNRKRPRTVGPIFFSNITN